MYEETDKKFFTKDLVILILKLIFLALFIFIVCWLFLRTNKNNTVKEVDEKFVNNINVMKTAAFEYFTKEKLPAKTGGSVKVTLEDMVNQKLLIDFTNNGQTCNLKESYVQATKTADENYALKVNLQCNNQTDYIVTTIESKNKDCSNCNNQPSTNTNNNNNVSVNENKDDQKTTTNNQTTTQKPAQVTTKIITKVTYKYTYHSLCSSCNDTSKTVKLYELVKYGDWQEGENNNPGYETKCSDDKLYKYCKVKNVVYYGTCTIPANSNLNFHNFMLQIPYFEEDKPFYVGTTYYSGLTDYETYINNKKTAPANNNSSDSNFYSTFPDMDPATMMASSLKADNFRVSNVGASYYQGNFILRYSLYINNYNNVKPYYSSNLGYNVYFLPIKITVGYNLKDSCILDTDKNAYKYSNYHKNFVANKSCMNRTVTKKWVEEKDLNKNINLGWIKTGNTKTETRN